MRVELKINWRFMKYITITHFQFIYFVYTIDEGVIYDNYLMYMWVFCLIIVNKLLVRNVETEVEFIEISDTIDRGKEHIIIKV
jgi:hypothetical protein